MPTPFRLVFLDDKATAEGREDQMLFGVRCTAGYQRVPGFPLEVWAIDDPDELLRHLSMADLLDGPLQAHALLLDVNFEDSPKSELALVDPLPDQKTMDKKEWGLDVLRTVKRIDPDFPVIVLTVLSDAFASYRCGRFGADDFVSKELWGSMRTDQDRQLALRELCTRVERAINNCEQRSVYDHEHRVIANRFAKDYDQVERSYCATIAYYHLENEWILNTVGNLIEKRAHPGRVRVLDLGCGTGRIEELLAASVHRDRLDVVAVDFAGKMLCEAQAKLGRPDSHSRVEFGRDCPDQQDGLLHVSLFCAPAENLDFLNQRYSTAFDFAVMGFGFLSYVKYTSVLPPAVDGPPSSGISRILKESGELLFSVYNEQSLIYDRVATIQSVEEERDLPIAAFMDLHLGRLSVGKTHYMACEAFTPDRIIRLVRQAGLLVDPDGVTCFPIVHLAMRNSAAASFPPDGTLPPGRYNEFLYQLDKVASHMIRGRGHYVLGLARKDNSQQADGRMP